MEAMGNGNGDGGIPYKKMPMAQNYLFEFGFD